MSNIMTRLEGAKEKFSDEKFLSNKGLSNEAGIHIFCYDPREEMVVRSYFADLIRKDMPFRLMERDLYKIFLQICQDTHYGKQKRLGGAAETAAYVRYC